MMEKYYYKKMILKEKLDSLTDEESGTLDYLVNEIYRKKQHADPPPRLNWNLFSALRKDFLAQLVTFGQTQATPEGVAVLTEIKNKLSL